MGSTSRPGVDDTAARLIVTPLVGVAVPNFAGMIDYSAHTAAGLVATYAWFIGIAFITWEANLRLYLLFQDRTAWLTRPWHRVRILVGLICLFTIPFTGSRWMCTSMHTQLSGGRFLRSSCRNCSRMQSSTTTLRPIILCELRSAWKAID